jgi:hypothetical protein
LAIRRTISALLLGLFSVVTLFAHQRLTRAERVLLGRRLGHKTHPTFFSDGLALVRKELWAHGTFCESSQQTDTVKVPRAFVERLTDAVCYAAWWLKSSTKGDLGNPDHRI